MTVWFDVEDLLHYARSGHKRVSGIQRLTLEIYRAAVEFGGVGFVRLGTGAHRLEVLQWEAVAARFAEDRNLVHRPARPSAARRLARRVAGRLPENVRGPLVGATVMQAQALAQFSVFGAGVAAHGAGAVARGAGAIAGPLADGLLDRRLRRHEPFEALAQPGDTLLVLGSPWIHTGYGALARWLRDERRMKFGVLVHDLVPVRHPEWVDEGVRRTFRDWYHDVLPFCDLVLANSRYTADDVEAYAREQRIGLPRRVHPVPVGTGFGPAPSARSALPGLPPPGSYVLVVSTVEARKNHALVVEVWRRLLAAVRAGTRPADSVPDLVFAGRIGWLVADLVQQLDNTSWLGGRIKLIKAPTDAHLRELYAGCLFSMFPSLYEGWGLPVTESLSLGAPCLTSNATSLPEAGGALCRYFDPQDIRSAHDAVAALLDDRPGLAAWRDQVQREFRPTSWTETARAVLHEVAAAAAG